MLLVLVGGGVVGVGGVGVGGCGVVAVGGGIVAVGDGVVVYGVSVGGGGGVLKSRSSQNALIVSRKAVRTTEKRLINF